MIPSVNNKKKNHKCSEEEDSARRREHGGMSPDWFYLKSPGRHMTRCGFSQCGRSSASSVAAQRNYVKYIPGLLGNKGGMVSSNQIGVAGLTCDLL